MSSYFTSCVVFSRAYICLPGGGIPRCPGSQRTHKEREMDFLGESYVCVYVAVVY